MHDNKQRISGILTFFDILLIVAILIVGVSSFFLVRSKVEPGENIEIFISSELKGVYSLNENRTIELTENTGKIFIRIEDRMVWILETSCPHKICQRMGKKKKAQDMVICVPNEMVIRITGKTGGKIEAVTQ